MMPQREPTITLLVNQQNMNVIMQALAERPYKEVAGTISWIAQCVESQSAAAMPAPPAPPVEEPPATLVVPPKEG